MEALSVYQSGAPLINTSLQDLTATARRLREIAVKPEEPTTCLLMVKVSDLKIDPAYQRFASPQAVRRIAADFNPLLLGTILVSLRADGEFYVIDGQHRVLGLIERGDVTREVPALVYEGLTQAEEAWVFSESQRRRRGLTPLDIFRSDLIWREDEAVAIHGIVERAGFIIRTDGDQSNQHGNISAVFSLRKAYALANGPRLLSTTLRTIAQAWGTRVGPRGLMIEGLAHFLNLFDHDDQLDAARLVHVLGLHSPDRIMSDSAKDAEVLSVGRPAGIAHRIHALYQNKLTVNRLPEWDEASRRERSRRAVVGHKTSAAKRARG